MTHILNTLKCAIGGVLVTGAMEVIQKGLHIMVATTLMDMLGKKMVTLSVCRYRCMDEVYRAIHGGKDQEKRSLTVEAFLKHQKDVVVATELDQFFFLR